MNWWNLKKNKCPQCDEPLFVYSCPCGFHIRERRWKEIIADMNHRDLEDRRDDDITDFEDDNFIARE